MTMKKKIKPVRVNLIDASIGASNRTNGTGWSIFSGRARRKEYWAKIVKAFFFDLLAVVLILAAAMYSSDSMMLVLVSGVVSVVVIVGAWVGLVLPVTVRRLHDRNMSGWWVLWFWLLSLIPFVGWIASVVQFVVIGCLEGTVGPNDFGADPKAEEHAALLGALNAAQASDNTVSHGAQPKTDIQNEASFLLKKLRELRAQGLITDAEYEEKRSKVLETI